MKKGMGGRRKISINRKRLTIKGREALLLVATLDLFSGKKSLGQVLKWLRVELLSLSQELYAKMVGVSRKALSDVESGKGKNGVEQINRVFSGVGFHITLMPRDNLLLKMAIDATSDELNA
ncbi:helix-turn-helix domain-containing protein [Shewanella putrefaciens]|uniref:helix-turn-helix domain-containing protein n=1 Tax=Shewanella putrefaciens TaxID=24 RepID=UPI00285992EC|nr:helix-turn-helix domain-containing protein [Shewanella putrefaciens]MDR6963059.1 DNA-binding XRE family transcriptional regulator [Shewanella putrefaciens]